MLNVGHTVTKIRGSENIRDTKLNIRPYFGNKKVISTISARMYVHLRKSQQKVSDNNSFSFLSSVPTMEECGAAQLVSKPRSHFKFIHEIHNFCWYLHISSIVYFSVEYKIKNADTSQYHSLRPQPCGESRALRWRDGYGLVQFVYKSPNLKLFK